MSKIRVGYVSADFYRHSASKSFGPLLTAYNREEFEVFCYSNSPKSDDITQEFYDAVDHWRNISGLGNHPAADLIRRDKIDILVDLSGHTVGNRLLMFALKPAPIQISGLGFGNTTGLEQMDYLFSDHWVLPLELAHLIPESPLYLSSLLHWQPPPDVLQVYEIPDTPPPEGYCAYITRDFPLLDNKYITFGCGNSLFKVTRAVREVWAGILKAVPDSRLAIKATNLEDAPTADLLLDSFEEFGIDLNRIELYGKSTHYEHLDFYNWIDIALDPFPYQGGITTCETLWMGKPVISLNQGATRGSVSVLNNAGMEDCIAPDIPEYTWKACLMAYHLLSLNKPQLRDLVDLHTHSLMNSPICNTQNFVNEIYSHYQALYQKGLS